MLIKIECARRWVFRVNRKPHRNAHVGKLWYLNRFATSLAKRVAVFICNNAEVLREIVLGWVEGFRKLRKVKTTIAEALVEEPVFYAVLYIFSEALFMELLKVGFGIVITQNFLIE